MESVVDTPVKRRKTETGHVAGSQGYDSNNDSGDELFKDYETVATVPLPKKSDTPSQHTDTLASIPMPYVTQPTQIIDRTITTMDSPGRQPSIIQVAASSPLRPVATTAPMARKPGGFLANMMAPPGTAYHAPVGVMKPKKPVVIDLSDDEGPKYHGGSSDEGSQAGRSVDIKPSVFKEREPKTNTLIPSRVRDPDAPCIGNKKFTEITSQAFYNPIKEKAKGLSGSVYDSRNRDESNTSSRIAAPKRSADVMANAYGGSSRPPKQQRQMGPAKAKPVDDMSLDDIPDFQQRRKVERVRTILPIHSIRDCYNALVTKHGNEDDALEMLIAKEEQKNEVDLTVSDDDQLPIREAVKFKAPAKQQLKAPSKTIQEKYTATQAQPRNTQPVVSSPVVKPPAQRRRLVQGRKRRSSPIPVPSPKALSPPPRQSTPESVGDSDSGLGSEPEHDPQLDRSLLDFFNSCSVQDLTDIAAITDRVALTVLARKPFKTLDEVRQVSDEAPATKSTAKKKTRKNLGEKIVDTCQTMWTGYEAVDQLVKRCEDLGKPVAAEMKKWGVDVFGASSTGELEIVNFDEIKDEDKSERSSIRDSGIGTPTSTADEDGDGDLKKGSEGRVKVKKSFFPQPSIMDEGVVLKDYQVVGINWLSLLFDKELSCILADDMGLGKTCQVIAFLASLLERGIMGPHLVVVPGSTLENWLREFSTFCPKLSVMPYYDGLKERPAIREHILGLQELPNVIITTYGIAKIKDDNKFLRRLKPSVCVFDEGHALKNSKSAAYEQLMRIPARFRLLLTGTPLQNNLGELASLLGFILPQVFREHSEDLQAIFSHKAKTTDETHSALLSAQRIARARSILTPFVLRRKKHQVLKHLPTKTRRVEYCELSESQLEIYTKEQERARTIIQNREAGLKTGNETTNIMMNLRKASIHPLLFRCLYDDKILWKMAKACMVEEEQRNSNVDLVYEDLQVMTDFELHTLCLNWPESMSSFALKDDEWLDSGKVAKMCELLLAFRANGDRVLIFSQFVMVLNILETVLESLSMKFFRLDGGTDINERQPLIDQFYEEEDITVFLLSTKAGGAGINLACANKVIIFDSSFNPQDDIQAENRAHRVGQTREVEVIRLVTKGTIEEQIHALGETKLALDERVAGEGMTEEEERKAERMGAKKVEEMMVRQIKEEGVAKG